MKLRSSRVLKRGKPKIDSGIEKEDTLGGFNENLEIGVKEIGNSDEKGLFLGSEVLDPVKDSVVSCPKGEIEEQSECSNGGNGEEGNGSVSVNISETGPALKEEIKSSNVDSVTFVDDKETLLNDPEKEEVKSPNVDSATLADDDETLVNDLEEVNVIGKRKRKRKRQKRKVIIECNHENHGNVSGVDGDGDECTVIPRKGKRVRKRKNVEGFECNGDRKVKKEKVEKNVVRVSGKVLRSRNTTTVSGGVDMVDDEFRGIVLGLKRADESIMSENVRPKKKIERRGRPRKMHDENPKPKKKIERRGRPRKIHDENPIPKKKIERRGRPRKMHDENPSPKKKIERRGRPRKIHDENPRPEKKIERRGRPRKIHDENPRPKKKQKRRGGPSKKQGEVTSPPLVKCRGRGRPLKMVSEDIIPIPMKSWGRPRKVKGKEGITKNRLKDMIVKKFKRRGRPPKLEAKTLASHVIKMRNMKLIPVKNTPKIQKVQNDDEKSVHSEGRQLKQKLLRGKIADMLLKSGWKIDRRERPFKTYKDAVYIEPNARRSHWSITRAYAMLKKKIEKGDADSNEISAFIEIPEQEMSILFKHVDKELGYKKKKNRIGKNVKKGKIITKKKKKLGKKRKRRNGIGSESRKPRLLVRSSDKGSKQDNEGCLVIKKRNLLSWMIDSGVILAGWKVQYGKTRRQKKSSEGTISNDGICCGCCDEVMGLSEFVSHCGGNTGQVFDNVYFDSEISLRKYLMDSWRKEDSNIIRFNTVVQGEDPNDDTCNICGDGGELVCCDGCPSTFHQSCLDIQNFPSGDWNCIYCLCKFCGLISATTQVEDSHDTDIPEMLSCHLCDEKFHQSCLQEVEDVNKDSNGPPFCGTKCREIYERLQTHIGVKNELEGGFSWTLLQRCDVDQDLTVDETQLKVEHNSKLAVAFSVMDECFVPIIDGRSGTSIIRNVVYNCGSNFRRLNYSGFVTAVLEKGDELITTASIRIHGYRLAEMPFIGTRHMYRRQGMCRRILDAIESTLASIGVEELIIPAIPELLETWTTAFGFMPLQESKRKIMKSMNMMVFPRIDMLEKTLRLSSSGEEKNANNDQLEEPAVVKDVIVDYIQTEEEEETVVTDRCSGPHLGNNKSIICDLNFPVKNVVQSDTDGQTSADSESFQDFIVGPSSLDSTSVENHQSPLTSKLVPKNMFDLNLHPSVVETDMNIVSDDSQVCMKSFELSDSSGAGQPDSKLCESQPFVML